MTSFLTISQRGACGTLAILLAACGGSINSVSPVNQAIPPAIQQIMAKPAYKGSTWSLRVVDLDSGSVVYDMNSSTPLLIGSVRKLFSVGAALDQLGAQYQFVTPVYAQGTVDATGALNGNLVLVASGDLTMGGRTNPDGSVAISSFDHNEANSLGGAILTQPDPLAGYASLAAQIAAAGIKRINGEVVVDDRLFQPFVFRGEFAVRPIFVNDDVVDVVIGQGSQGTAAPLSSRPLSQAFSVQSTLAVGSPGSEPNIELAPELPTCIGQTGCTGSVSGNIPVDFVPPLTNQYPLIRTFRITDPSSYARTVLIEALQRAGVVVSAAAVEPNPVQILPAPGTYASSSRVAQLVSPTYAQYARFILKVSYNIGADTSLVLFGLANNGSTTISGALVAESGVLAKKFGVPVDQLHFIDGSGGGDTTATGVSVTAMLDGMRGSAVFSSYVDALPNLGVDGSLATVTAFEADPTLAGAQGQVHAKTGTFVAAATAPASGIVLKGQALAGYVDAKSGRRLSFALTVNNVPINGIPDVVNVFQDEGTIAATIWKLQ
ncbi:peptidase S13 [Paraburkholderia sp. UYCP14C]|uniref:D-alanyl-D-alanine carboxypeptidase n=1 Tax=Paraburkholderia sp. UYCP14C TaxID=2511130 RepID=UPI0010201642|nr:D-alanyl-D-alanine carboxypeptidase [Paraburkholderia sp. UYCP14C]RZF27132.1 peptidase S13 [Paraburkholderia sp. UYCP14C]